MRKDTILHFAISGALVAAIAGGLHWHGMKKQPALALGLGAGLALGAAKEVVLDGRLSRSDLAANLAGAVTATVTLKINIAPKKNRKIK